MIIKLYSGAKLEILHLNVENVEALQSQSVKGEAVIVYREPLTTQGLKFSGFPEGQTTWQNGPHPLTPLSLTL